MEVATAHRNQNIPIHHPIRAASPIVGRMVRSDGHRPPVKQQEGMFLLCKKVFRFVAELCQASYDSITKTTPPPTPAASPTPATPRQAGFANPFALSLSKPVLRALEGPVLRALEGGRPPHPDTSPFPQPATPRYPPPMQPANKALNQHTPAPWRAAPASSASTTTSGSAPNSRGVVSHGRKHWDKDFIAKTNTPATTTPPKQPPATPAPQSNLPATTPAPWCVAPAWSTAMVKAGSSSNRRGCLYSAKTYSLCSCNVPRQLRFHCKNNLPQRHPAGVPPPRRAHRHRDREVPRQQPTPSTTTPAEAGIQKSAH